MYFTLYGFSNDTTHNSTMNILIGQYGLNKKTLKCVRTKNIGNNQRYLSSKSKRKFCLNNCRFQEGVVTTRRRLSLMRGGLREYRLKTTLSPSQTSDQRFIIRNSTGSRYRNTAKYALKRKQMNDDVLALQNSEMIVYHHYRSNSCPFRHL